MSRTGSGRTGIDPVTGMSRKDLCAAVMKRFGEPLQPYEVEAPRRWRQFVHAGWVFPHECFERSFEFVEELMHANCMRPGALRGVWLVHGEYMNLVRWDRHAWVELPGQIVFDGVLQRFYQKQGYYDTIAVRPWYKYSTDAVSFLAMCQRKLPNGYLPMANWHVLLKLPGADPENPTEIGEKEVEHHLVAAGLIPDFRRAANKSRRKRSS